MLETAENFELLMILLGFFVVIDLKTVHWNSYSNSDKK